MASLVKGIPGVIRPNQRGRNEPVEETDDLRGHALSFAWFSEHGLVGVLALFSHDGPL